MKLSETVISKDLFRATLRLQTSFEANVNIEDKEFETKTIDAIKQHLLKRKFAIKGAASRILTTKTEQKLGLGDKETVDFELVKTPWDKNEVVPIQVLAKKASADSSEATQKSLIRLELCLFLESIQPRDSSFSTILNVVSKPHLGIDGRFRTEHD